MTNENASDYRLVPAAPLRQFDLRTTPERFDTWCSALERRIEAQNVEIAALRKRLARLELAKDTP